MLKLRNSSHPFFFSFICKLLLDLLQLFPIWVSKLADQCTRDEQKHLLSVARLTLKINFKLLSISHVFIKSIPWV